MMPHLAISLLLIAILAAGGCGYPVPADHVGVERDNRGLRESLPRPVSQIKGSHRTLDGSADENKRIPDPAPLKLGSPKGVQGTSKERLRNDVRRTIEYYQNAVALTDTPNWARLHTLLLFGESAWAHRTNSTVLARLFPRIVDDAGQKGGPFVLRLGVPVPNRGGQNFNFEQHRDQFLHLLSMGGVPLNAPLRIEGQEFNVLDLLNYSLKESRCTGDVSWTISAYAYYLAPGDRWTNKFGESLTFKDLLGYAVHSPSPSCGGAHRLFGFARVLAREELRAAPELRELIPQLTAILEDEWEFMRRRQNPDGSLPLTRIMLEQAEKLGLPTDPIRLRDLRLLSNGHTLEWAATVFPPERLNEAWLAKGISRTAEDLKAIVGSDIRPVKDDIRLGGREERYGSAAHAVSGLLRWYAKVSTKKLSSNSVCVCQAA
jgi:hypothetical protein